MSDRVSDSSKSDKSLALTPTLQDDVFDQQLEEARAPPTPAAEQTSTPSEQLHTHEHKLDVLLAFLWEFDDRLPKFDQKLTSSQELELQIRLDRIKELESAIMQLVGELPKAVQGTEYSEKYEKKFYDYFYPVVRRAEIILDPSKEMRIERRRPKVPMRQTPPETEFNLTIFDRFYQSIEKLEKMEHSKERRRKIDTLSVDYFSTVLNAADVRYFKATETIREKLLFL